MIDLQTRAENRVIVESTVQMAHALGLQVVAEGVESEWVKDYLLAVGYDLGQGYWFARPMPAEEIPKLDHEVQHGGPRQRDGRPGAAAQRSVGEDDVGL